MSDRVSSVVVVGGGDAGLLAALTLEKLVPSVDVTVIDDFDEPAPNVGKSTIPYIQETIHEVLGVDRKRFVSAVRPVWKASVYFRDWCGRDSFHVPFDDFTLQPADAGPERFETLYHRHNTCNYRTMGVELAERRKSPFLLGEGGRLGTYPHVAYHLDVERFSQFLQELCDERDVKRVNDRIVDVRTDENVIACLEGELGSYEGDLYLDATGFARVLMNNLDNPFQSFKLPLDAAVFGKRDITVDEIIPATVVESGKFGWFWGIDTTDWRDRGYVYASSYITEDEAIEEFLDNCSVPRSAIKTHQFDSGVYDRAWLGNCVAVGNALGFVEPLQSTALSTNAILVEQLATLLRDNYRINHRGIRTHYNEYAQDMWENIYEFISVHYRYAPPTTDFWADVSTAGDGSVTGEESPAAIEPVFGDSSSSSSIATAGDNPADRHVKNYHRNGFTSHHEMGRDDGPARRIFNQWQFYRVLRSMGVRSDFYEGVDIDVSPGVRAAVDEQTAEIGNRADRHLTYGELVDRGLY